MSKRLTSFLTSAATLHRTFICDKIIRKVIQFLVNFSFSSAAILDFEKWRFRPVRCLGGVRAKLCAKFGENRTNGSGVIQVLVNFKMAAGGHLGL